MKISVNPSTGAMEFDATPEEAVALMKLQHEVTVAKETAEENAGKISVKMMIPMLVFVLPSTLIILLGPMLFEWFSKGL